MWTGKFGKTYRYMACAAEIEKQPRNSNKRIGWGNNFVEVEQCDYKKQLIQAAW